MFYLKSYPFRTAEGRDHGQEGAGHKIPADGCEAAVDEGLGGLRVLHLAGERGTAARDDGRRAAGLVRSVAAAASRLRLSASLYFRMQESQCLSPPASAPQSRQRPTARHSASRSETGRPNFLPDCRFISSHRVQGGRIRCTELQLRTLGSTVDTPAVVHPVDDSRLLDFVLPRNFERVFEREQRIVAGRLLLFGQRRRWACPPLAFAPLAPPVQALAFSATLADCPASELRQWCSYQPRTCLRSHA